MDKNSEMMIKISHIGVINMMEDKIGKNVSSFKELEKYTLENLEELRDNLVVEYNDVIEARRFGAEMYFVNKDDWQEKFWRNNYHVWLTAQGIQFCVNADCAGDAMDYIMDYCVENKLVGLYTTHEDKDWEKEEEYITAGNNGYQFTTHNIRIEIID